MTEQQPPASVVERLRAPHGGAYRLEAAALIESLSAENADLRERVEMFEAEEYDRQQGE